MLLILLISLYTARVVLRELGVVDYGIYNVVGGFIALVGFLSAALAQTTQRFIAFEIGRPEGQLGTVFSTAVFTHLSLAIAIYLVGHFAGVWAIDNFLNFPDSRQEAAQVAFRFSLLMFCMYMLQAPFIATVMAQERMHVFASISVLDSLMKLAVALSIAFAVTDRLVHYAGYLFATSVVVFIAYVIACSGVILLSNREPRWDLATAKAMVYQIGWNLWGNVAAALGDHGVNLLLNVFFGPAINAARAIALQAHTAVGMFHTNIQTAVTPQITKSYAAGDHMYFGRLVNSGAKLFGLVFIATAIPVILEIDYLLKLWLADPPEYAAIFTRLLVLTLLARALSGTLQSAAQSTGKVRGYNVILGTVALVNIPMCWVILRTGATPESVLYVGLVIAFIMIPIQVLLVARIAPISIITYYKDVIGPVVSIGAVTLLLALFPYLTMEPSFGRVVATAAASIFGVIASSLLFGLNQYEKNFVRRFAINFYSSALWRLKN